MSPRTTPEQEGPDVSSALPRPAAARAAGLALALLALTGCGAGFEAQTYLERSSADSDNAAVGAIAVRNAAVLPPEREGLYEEGDDADVILTLVNVGSEDDRLVGVETEAADVVELQQDGDTVDEVVVPRLGTTGSTAGLVLRGMTEELRSGRVIELTLTFERSGDVVVEAPVQTTGVYDEERERSENFHPPGEEEHGEGHSEETGSGDTVNAGDSEGTDGGGVKEAGEETAEQAEGEG